MQDMIRSTRTSILSL